MIARIFCRRRRQLEQERDYLLRWFGGFDAELTGLSADTLTRIAFGETSIARTIWEPSDRGDLGRCERAYEKMPRHLQKICRPTLNRWQKEIAALERERGR